VGLQLVRGIISSSSSITPRLGPTGPFRLQNSSKTVLSISSLIVPQAALNYNPYGTA
jgi:hypothetical protein